MRVTWDSRVGRLEIEGSHKKGTPRIWTISVQAYKAAPGRDDLERMTMTVRPRGKVLLTALDAIVRSELKQYEPEFVTFQAVAR